MQFITPGVRREAIAWFRLSLPATLRGMSENLPSVLALIFVGRLGTSELAAVSISDVWMYSTAMIVWMGLSNTQASLVAQAHGAGNVAAARGWAFIGLGLNLVGAALCAVWWAATDPVLNALTLDSRLDRASVRAYSRWSILSLLPIAFNCVVSAQLVSLQLPLAPMLVEFVTCLIDVPAMYLFIFGVPPSLRGYGVTGSALAMFASQLVASACYACAAWWLLRGRVKAPQPEHLDDAGSTEPPLPLPDGEGAMARLLEEPLVPAETPRSAAALAPLEPPSLAVDCDGGGSALLGKPPPVAAVAEWLDAPWADTWAFCGEARNWRTFLGQAGGSCLSVALELWQLQIVSFLAATLGPVDIATHNCLITLFELISTLLYGMGEALSVRVGYHLGRRSVAEAKRVCAIAFAAATGVSALLALAMTGAHDYVGRIFSDDPAVIALASQLIYLCSCAYVMLANCMMALSTLQGQSRTTTMAVTFVVGCWCVCIPLSFLLLAYTGLGLLGLWTALLCGYSVATAIAVAAVWRSDWERLADAAAERLASGEEAGTASGAGSTVADGLG